MVKDAGVTTRDRLERLYRDRGDRIWWSVLAFAGDRSIADDAVAEAFMRALREGERIREPEPWVWRVAFRVASGELKRRKRESSVSTSVESTYALEAPSDSVLAVVGQLSPRQRSAVVLHYYAGYSTREIGDIVGSSAATVAVHLHQGRKRLRQLLEDDHD